MTLSDQFQYEIKIQILTAETLELWHIDLIQILARKVLP